MQEYEAAVPSDSRYPAVAEHVARYVETGGEIGHIWREVPTLVLTTTGRRSGLPRRTALIYGRDGGDLVVVASNLGADRHPDWYLNLRAEPRAVVQVGSDRHPVVASVATGDRRHALWDAMKAVWPDYEGYQAKTDRVIPVVVLSRDGTGSARFRQAGA